MYEMKAITPIDGRREELTTEERKAFKKLVKAFGTMTNAARELKLSKNTIERVMLVGSGHPDTIGNIRTHINARNVA